MRRRLAWLLLRASGEAIEYTEHNGQPVPLTALVTTELARLVTDAAAHFSDSLSDRMIEESLEA